MAAVGRHQPENPNAMRTAGLLIAWAASSLITVSAQTDKETKEIDLPTWAVIDDSLGHALDLTNDQMKLVQEADEHYRERVAKGDDNAIEMRERDIKAALLPSQYKEWQAVAAKRKGATLPVK